MRGLDVARVVPESAQGDHGERDLAQVALARRAAGEMIERGRAVRPQRLSLDEVDEGRAMDDARVLRVDGSSRSASDRAGGDCRREGDLVGRLGRRDELAPQRVERVVEP